MARLELRRPRFTSVWVSRKRIHTRTLLSFERPLIEPFGFGRRDFCMAGAQLARTLKTP
jgi:hypothetical protein